MLNLRPVWGIDVGDSALKAVKLKRVGKQTVLLDFQILRYSELSGELGARREAVLPQALAALRAAGLGRDRCFVSIAPQAIFSRFISLPPVDKRRIPEIVLYEARQQIPFSLSEVIWAYQTVRKEFIPGEEIEIGLFAVKRDVMEEYLGELAPIARQLHGVQIAPLGLYNFVRHDLTLEKPTVVMDIGAQSTDLLIVDSGKFWLRNLPIAGNSFTAVLEKRLNIPREEAEKLKMAVPESRHRRKLLEVLRPVMRDLVGEIQRSIGYYKSLSQDVKFEEILVVGEGYRVFGLDRFLTERLQYKVTPVHQLRNILFQGAPERVKELGQAIPSLGVAIGLALQGLGQAHVDIDLLPDDFVVDRELHHKRFSGLIAAALVCGVVGCFYLKESRSLDRVAGMMDSGQKTLAEVERIKSEYIRAMLPADPKKLAMYGDFGKHRQYDSMVIDAVSRVIPRGVRIDQFEFERARADMFFPGRGSEPGRGRSARRRSIPGVGDPGGFRRPGGALPDPSGRPPGGAPPGPSGRPPGSGAPRSRGRPAGLGSEALYHGGPAGPSTEERKVDASEVTLSFTVWCAAEKEAQELERNLPKALKRATLFPEGVELVTGVVVGTITTTAASHTEDGAVVEKTELTATVRVGLLGPEQAVAAREKKRKEVALALAAKARESETGTAADTAARIE